MIVFMPRSSEEDRLGMVSVFSWNTKQDSKATISAGS